MDKLLERQFVCRSCLEGGPDWMCQCDNDEAWERWMLDQELRTLNEARATQGSAPDAG